MEREDTTPGKISYIGKFTAGFSMLVWSLACAILVGNSISITDPTISAFIFGPAVLLVFLPPLGAYLLIIGTIGIVKEIHDKPQ